jgi:hypothetical protein
MRLVDRQKFIQQIKKKPKKRTKYATIDPTYTSGAPCLIFDGESAVTLKAYPYLGTYTPVAGHRVKVDDGVVVGNIVY